MKVKDARAGDVFINPADQRCIFLLTSITWDDSHTSYSWFNLATGHFQDFIQTLEDSVASEWVIIRGDVVMQESELAEGWKEILEAVT